MFIILTGSSGSGKNTIIKEMESLSNKYRLMPTITTRSKRDGEIEGYPYYFTSKEEFQSKIKNGELLEHEFIHNNYYGSSYEIFEKLKNEDKVLIKDIGIEGAQNLQKKLADKTDVLKIFLTTKNKYVLKKRLKKRGEKQIKLRLKRFKKEQAERFKFDYIILNNNLQNTVKIISKIHEIDLDEFLPTIPTKQINLKKVKRYCDSLVKDKILKPIEVCLCEDKVYIMKGHEKFIASLLSNKPVAKKICLKNIKSKLNESEIMEWKNLVRESINN